MTSSRNDAASRTVRIFISSTFRDFAVERDLLVRKICPELRRRCRKRQVELIDVDLRWGITEAEAEQGKVLPICLAEIDRARPFFMALLGERYGWVPAAEQFDRSLLIEQPWLEEHAGGTSVTELEILHGVLNNPQMAGRAFFYFRDPAWSANQGTDYASASEAEREKLAALKARIRTSGFPVVENYPDPEALAERVREDLWNLIDAAYPETDVPDPLTLERRRHEAYGGARRRLYLGGERYFEALDTELAAESPRPLLVRGKSGGGKSALIANWLARWSQAHPDTAVIVHHLGCGADAADPVRLAVRIMQEIALLVGEEFKPKSDPDEQLDELATWLATASAWAMRTGRTVLIVLDGLDKLADRRHLRWFPTALPHGVRLVASCLDGDVLEAVGSRLDWRELVVKPFTAAEQKRFISDYLGRFRKQLTAGQVKEIQRHPLSCNPLFLLTVLEELRVFGEHEQLDQRLTTLLSPPPSKQPGEEPTVDDVFEHVLARLEGDVDRESVQRVVEAVWSSRAGLFVNEILDIASVPPATWAALENALDEALYESGGRVNFGHDYLRKAVEDRYGIQGEARLKLHHRLAKYFDRFEPDPRVAEELPWQWREAQDRTSLRACLTNLEMFAVLRDRDEYELLRYWIWLGEDANAAYEKAYGDRAGDPMTQERFAWALAGFLKTAGYYKTSDFVVFLYRHMLQDREVRLGPNHPDTLAGVNGLAIVLCSKGDYAAAEVLHRRVVEYREKSLGFDHPGTLLSINNLAVVLRHKGDCAAAEALHRRCLERCEQSLGPDHPDSLDSANNLALVLCDKGDYALAEALLLRVLESRDKSLGPGHPITLGSVANLATVLQDQGNYVAAEALCRRALEGREQCLGPCHPDTLQSVHNLATVLRDQGDYAAAEALCRRVVEYHEQSLEPDHPDSLHSVNNLAVILHDKGDYALAEALHRRVLEGREKSLGPDHPDTLGSVQNLATVLVDQGDYPAAEGLCRRVLQGQEKSLGPDNPITLGSVANLAVVLRHKGEWAAAEALYRRALDGLEKSLGPDHPDTLLSANNLSCVLIDQGDYPAAEALCRRVLDRREKSLGPDHPDTLRSVETLADVLSSQGHYTKAEAMYRRALAGYEKSFSPDHPSTLRTVNNFATFLSDQREYTAAESLYRRALEGLEKSAGPDHPHTLTIVDNLAAVLCDQEKYAVAEAVFHRVFEARKKSLGPDHPDTLESANRLAIAHAICVDTLPPPPRGNPFSDPPGTVTNSIGMKLVPIPAGDFLMGSPADCPVGDPEEEFQHWVRLTKPFLMGMHQVTQVQYEQVTGANPSFFKGPDLPVEHLSWKEAHRFCTLLSSLPAERKAGRQYRLPTEAEWEYACRAGTTTTFNTGDCLEMHQARFATTSRTSPKSTASVGSYPPNSWGLYDMHGNVWEWTSDWFSADYFRDSPVDDPQGPATGTHHTLRGGSASVEAHECRCAIRGEATAVDGPETDTGNRYPLYGDFGIRVVCQQSMPPNEGS